MRIQDVLRSHNHVGEKTRKHPHYLKSTVYCGECGGRLVYSRNTGNGGTYEYYICITHKTKRQQPCSQRSVRLDRIEAGIARLYEGLQLAPYQVVVIQEAVRHELSTEQARAEEDAERARKQLHKLRAERKKLLQAHYADAVPLDLLKKEMARITRETQAAEQAIIAASKTLVELHDALDRALVVAAHCEREYVTAPPRVRRYINQGLFRKLFIGRDGTVTACEMTEPFGPLLGSRLGVAQMDGETRDVATTEEGPPMRPATDSDRSGRRSDVLAGVIENDLAEAREDRLTTIFSGLHKIHLVPPKGFGQQGNDL